MKNPVLKSVFVLPFLVLILHGCSIDDPAIEDEKYVEAQVEKTPLLPAYDIELAEILGVRNSEGKVVGWYYYSEPNQVYEVASENLYLKSQSSTELVSLVGDMDVFGYSPSRTHPPCAYFDLSEPEDVGVFDKLVRGTSDAEKTWTHDYRSDPQFCSGFTANEVTIQIKEYYNDTYGTVKVQIDGIEMDFTQNGILSRCSGKTNTVQTFTFTGSDAAFANDGVINITVLENGEEIALDYSLVTVKYSLTNPTSNIVIADCDTGIVDQLRNCQTLSEIINDLQENATNHGQFVSEVSQLTNLLIEEGLLTQEEKDAIMKCTAKAV